MNKRFRLYICKVCNFSIYEQIDLYLTFLMQCNRNTQLKKKMSNITKIQMNSMAI